MQQPHRIVQDWPGRREPLFAPTTAAGHPPAFRASVPAVIAAIVIGGIVSSGAFWYARGAVERARDPEIETKAGTVEIVALSELAALSETARATAAYMEAFPNVDAERFKRFVTRSVQRRETIHSLSWSPSMSHAERLALADSPKGPSFSVTELDARGKIVPSDKHNMYYPVLFEEPPRSVGLNQAVLPRRLVAFRRSAERGGPYATTVHPLVDAPQRLGFSIVVPVDLAPRPNFERVPSMASVRGFVSVVVDVEALIDSILEGIELRDMDIAIHDADELTHPIWESRKGVASRVIDCEAMCRHVIVRFDGRRWRIDVQLVPSRGIPLVFGWVLLGPLVALAVLLAENVRLLRAAIRRAEKLGQYRVGAKIGQGAMGQVFLAQHLLLRRPAALKLLSTRSPSAIARFEREVQLSSNLRHPNTVKIYDYGQTDETLFYYVMEYIHGLTLEEVVKGSGPMVPGRVASVMRQIASALQEAHQAGIIHRDLKPSNVMVSVRGEIPDFVKVLDFGLVKQVGHADNPPSAERPGSAEVSRAGEFIGTPRYSAPEAVKQSGALGPASDLYALGAVAYYMLTGTPPFTQENALAVLSAHLLEEPERPSDRLGQPLPEGLEHLIMACLRKEPSTRPASAAAIVARLNAVMDEIGGWNRQQAWPWWQAVGFGLVERNRSFMTADPDAP